MSVCCASQDSHVQNADTALQAAWAQRAVLNPGAQGPKFDSLQIAGVRVQTTVLGLLMLMLALTCWRRCAQPG